MNAEKFGFRLVVTHFIDAIKEIKSEFSILRPILQKIYDSQNIIAKGIKLLSSLLFSKITGAMVLLVFQKK